MKPSHDAFAGAEYERPLIPAFLSYVLSFVFLGIYMWLIPDRRIERALAQRD